MKESKQIAQTIKELTGDLIEKITSQKQEIDDQQEEINDLKGELDNLNDKETFELTKLQNNLRTASCIQQLFDNLDRIPISELENLTEKYSL